MEVVKYHLDSDLTITLFIRIESIQWLNSSVNADSFLLDGLALNTREKRNIGLSRLVPNTPSTAPLSR